MDPEVEWVGNFFNTVPQVDAVGEEGVVLRFEDDDEEGSAALADILAFGILIFAAGVAEGAGEGLAAVVLVGRCCAWPRMNSTVASPPMTVNQLNLNSGLCLTLQLEVCRSDRFKKSSTVFAR